MPNEGIDFSPLDPQRDPRRHEHRIQAMLARWSWKRPSFRSVLVGRGPAVVGAAAAVAIIAWLPALFREHGAEAAEALSLRGDPIELVSRWAQRGEVPGDVDPVQALSGAGRDD